MLYMTVQQGGISSCQPRTTNWQSCFVWSVLLRSNFKQKEWSNTAHLCLSVIPVSQHERPLPLRIVIPFLKSMGHELQCCVCLPTGKQIPEWLIPRFHAGLFPSGMKCLARIVTCSHALLKHAHVNDTHLHLSVDKWVRGQPYAPIFPVSCC